MRDGGAEDGVVALETAAGMALVMLALLAILQVLGFARHLLLVHEAARAGARAAAATADDAEVIRAASEASDGVAIRVTVTPPDRASGDLAEVVVRSEASIGPLRSTVSARAAARVEPGVGP